MFSGIIEVTSPIRKVEELSHLVRIWVERPSFYTDIKIGDSIAVNGVCLTVEAFDSELIQFALAHETLKLLEIQRQDLPKHRVNLERSLRFGDRLHGQLVAGHVEPLGNVLQVRPRGGSLRREIRPPKRHRPHV